LSIRPAPCDAGYVPRGDWGHLSRGRIVPRAVRLTRGTPSISATDLLASNTRFTAYFHFDQPSGGENRDVGVEYEDGSETRLGKAFAIAGV
jgi:hypothetical protein